MTGPGLMSAETIVSCPPTSHFVASSRGMRPPCEIDRELPLRPAALSTSGETYFNH